MKQDSFIFQSIIDSMEEGIVFVDAHGRITLCNYAAEKIRAVKSNIGKPLLDCHPPSSHSKLLKMMEDFKEGRLNLAKHPVMKDRSKVYENTYMAVRDEKGEFLGIVLVSRDITHRIELERQLVQQEKMAGIGQMAAGIAHALNTPLGTIWGYAQMLEEGMEDNGALTDIKAIKEQAERCKKIVQDLLDFSRRPSGIKTLEDINHLVKKCLSLRELDLGVKGIEVSSHLDDNSFMAMLEPKLFQEAIFNLINNSVDAMPEGGQIKIWTQLSKGKDLIEIRIKDTGLGIKKEYLSRIFDPFFTTKEVGRGTGLGLPITQRIIQEHGGTIEVESQEGMGTTVILRLPRFTSLQN